MPTTFYNDVPSDSLVTAMGGSPANGDSLYFYRDSVTYLNTLDQSAVDFLAINFAPGFMGDIPTTDFKFVCDRTSTGLVDVQWGGRYLRLASSSAAAIVYEMRINPANGGKVDARTMHLKNASVMSGAFNVMDSVLLDLIRVSGGQTFIDQSATSPTIGNLYQTAGVCETKRLFTAGEVRGGELRLTHKDVSPGALTVHNGIVRFGTASGPMGPTLGALAAYAGTLDFSQLSRPLTMTTTSLSAAVRIINPIKPNLITWGAVSLPDGVDPRLAR